MKRRINWFATYSSSLTAADPVDKQGITGSKIDYHSLPYRSITHFSIETGGHFDLDAELRVWVSGTAEPIKKEFNKRLNIYEVQGVLASYILK